MAHWRHSGGLSECGFPPFAEIKLEYYRFLIWAKIISTRLRNPVPESSLLQPATLNWQGKRPRLDLPRLRREQQGRRAPLGIVNTDLSAKGDNLFRILAPAGLRGRRASRSGVR